MVQISLDSLFINPFVSLCLVIEFSFRDTNLPIYSFHCIYSSIQVYLLSLCSIHWHCGAHTRVFKDVLDLDSHSQNASSDGTSGLHNVFQVLTFDCISISLFSNSFQPGLHTAAMIAFPSSSLARVVFLFVKTHYWPKAKTEHCLPNLP